MIKVYSAPLSSGDRVGLRLLTTLCHFSLELVLTRLNVSRLLGSLYAALLFLVTSNAALCPSGW